MPMSPTRGRAGKENKAALAGVVSSHARKPLVETKGLLARGDFESKKEKEKAVENVVMAKKERRKAVSPPPPMPSMTIESTAEVSFSAPGMSQACGKEAVTRTEPHYRNSHHPSTSPVFRSRRRDRQSQRRSQDQPQSKSLSRQQGYLDTSLNRQLAREPATAAHSHGRWAQSERTDLYCLGEIAERGHVFA
ncbi:hypothetical protein CALCODRAFT_61475 [Calocera cornea HHB12733]|uniref:Uncharacterized protein n=1 Tax=Calocera cornea HHB12733 TaxID=1353952 RepID=A0A165DMD5_9BASI|nr:hypothetical protein CALCODRAFT_61475 [Calocera cornea HHB12733]